MNDSFLILIFTSMFVHCISASTFFAVWGTTTNGFLNCTFMFSGGLAEGGYPDNLDDSQSRNNQEPQDSRVLSRSQDLVPPYQRCETVRPWMVYVSDQYGSDEVSSWISRRCRWVYSIILSKKFLRFIFRTMLPNWRQLEDCLE